MGRGNRVNICSIISRINTLKLITLNITNSRGSEMEYPRATDPSERVTGLSTRTACSSRTPAHTAGMHFCLSTLLNSRRLKSLAGVSGAVLDEAWQKTDTQ